MLAHIAPHGGMRNLYSTTCELPKSPVELTGYPLHWIKGFQSTHTLHYWDERTWYIGTPGHRSITLGARTVFARGLDRRRRARLEAPRPYEPGGADHSQRGRAHRRLPTTHGAHACREAGSRIWAISREDGRATPAWARPWNSVTPSAHSERRAPHHGPVSRAISVDSSRGSRATLPTRARRWSLRSRFCELEAFPAEFFDRT